MTEPKKAHRWWRELRLSDRWWKYALGLAVVQTVAVWFLVPAVLKWRHQAAFNEALAAVRQEYPGILLQFNSETERVVSLTNLEGSARLTAPSQDPEVVAKFIQEFVQRPTLARVMTGDTVRARLQQVTRFTDPHRPAYDLVRFDQFVQDVRVFGLDIVASIRGGRSAALNSVAAVGVELPHIDTNPTVDGPTARTLAATMYASLARDRRTRLPADRVVSELELMIFDPRPFGFSGKPGLAWRTRIGTLEMFFDAHSREHLLAYDLRRAGRNRMTYDCANAIDCALALREDSQPTPSTIPDAVEVHAAAATAHAYFQTTFNRNGFDDTGKGGTLPIESFVRVPDLPNAQWHSGLRRLEFAPGWATTDIVGHEYTHALTEFVARLTLPGEPGAVAEFFSDFFAARIEASVTGKADWLIGERVAGFSVQQPVRNMAHPHTNGFDRNKQPDPKTNGGQPEHFDELVSGKDLICGFDPLQDNGCVHFNGGILSKAAVLASDGGTFRDVTVRGVSAGKLEQILFRTVTRMPAASGLKQTAALIAAACSSLVAEKQHGVRADDCMSVEQALAAVGLR
jgi:hypothetical protein